LNRWIFAAFASAAISVKTLLRSPDDVARWTSPAQ
jgi:hypothetical protein